MLIKECVAYFECGAWRADVLEQPLQEGVTIDPYFVKLYRPKGGDTAFPLRVDGECISYDLDRPPKDARRVVKRSFAWIDSQLKVSDK